MTDDFEGGGGRIVVVQIATKMILAAFVALFSRTGGQRVQCSVDGGGPFSPPESATEAPNSGRRLCRLVVGEI